MFSCLRDAFGPMDYQPQVVVKKDAHGHKKPVQEFVFNSYQNSIDNAAQVPRVVRCAELPVCAVLRRVLGSCARAGCARELRGLPRGANAPTSAATLQASALGIFQA